MKIKTSELTGAALDWAVAICSWGPDRAFLYGDTVKHVRIANRPGIEHSYMLSQRWEPSTDWAQGGPILVGDMIMYSYAFGLFWTWLHDDPEGDRNPRASGPTLLVAIARCRVASKLGDEVDIPEELLK